MGNTNSDTDSDPKSFLCKDPGFLPMCIHASLLGLVRPLWFGTSLARLAGSRSELAVSDLIADLAENIRKPQNADNPVISGNKQRLVAAHDDLMDRLV